MIHAELGELTAIRRDLHAHPELMFEERRTSGKVVAELTRLGIEHRAGLARGTGVVGHLPGARANVRAVALRADMDALPMPDDTGAAHASTTPGVAHACGHDGHTAILLGAARVLSAISDRPNPVTLLFQPAEEGGGGGKLLCDEGALDGAGHGAGLGASVQRVFGLHGWPTMPLGTVATRPGPLLASTDDFLITVQSTGGHAAFPHMTRDPIVCAAAIVSALQTIASRNVSPLDSVVCTVGRIEGGSANNVIPKSVELEGTVRALRDTTRAFAKQRLFAIVEHIAKAHDCPVEIQWHEGYPVTHNTPELAARFDEITIAGFGPERVTVVPEPVMGGEDFSYYSAKAQTCFFLLGLCPAGADPAAVPLLHQPGFDFNDDAIAMGVEAMCRLALAEWS